MSKENNLNDFLTDLGSAIKDMRGTGEKINAQDYSKEVRAIGPLFDTIYITENGLHDVKNYKNASVLVESQADINLKNLIEKNVSEYEVPYGVEKIGTYSLYGDFNKITFKGSELITRIEDNACYKITYEKKATYATDLILPNCTYIGKSAFAGRIFNKIDLQNCEEIRDNAFFTRSSAGDYIYGNTEINLPKCKKIGFGAFQSIARVSRNYDYSISVNIPECTELGQAAFMGNAIRYLNAPKLTAIQQNCFSAASVHTGLTGELKIPENVVSIGKWAFRENSITSVIFNNKCVTLGANAFEECEKLEKVQLNEGLQSIGQQAFYGCIKLKTIEIPSSVTAIDYNAFNSSVADKLTVIMNSTTPPTIATNTFNKTYLNRIYVPTGTINTYKSATNWSTFADYIVEPNDLFLNVPNELLNNENYMYSIDDGKTYNQFTSTTLALEDIAVIKLKSITSDTTILIGTTEGGSDVGTISNSELTYATTSGTLTLYLTIQ